MTFISSAPPQAHQDSTAISNGSASPRVRRLFLVLGAIALVYAFVAGFRTAADPDLGWQMASGRWVAQHHQIFSTEVFSYTANGQPWIYPIGSALLFYGIYLLGGYALLSWFGAAACVGTVALLLRRGSAFTAAVAVLAIPLIADRSTPRAEMFTVILFAAYLSILWQNYETSRAPLWMLPLLMILWVNLHLGFIAGLLLLAGFVGLDLLEIVTSASRRSEALRRLRRSVPWFAASAVCTLLNPWGWGLYRAIIRQNRVMEQHSRLIDEWAKAGWHWSGSMPSFSGSPLAHTLTVLLLVVVLAALIAIWQRRWGAIILLLGAMYESVRHIRMEALTACIVVVVAGALFSQSAPRISLRIASPRMRSIAAVVAAVLVATLAFWRSAEFVSGRAYLASNSLNGFGAGPGWWFPQGAAEFMNRENLPRNVFNTYDEGGYLVWKTGLKYPDYIDGRAIPFGLEALPHEQQLLGETLDSADWQTEADRYNINTVILPIGGGEIAFEQVPSLCYGEKWAPVYLDELAIVLVRRTPANQPLIDSLRVNCAIASLPGAPLGHDARSFPQWVNTASLLGVLNRHAESLAAADNALQIFPGSARLRRIRGVELYAVGRRTEAEEEWLTALALSPGDAVGNASVWPQLADMYEKQGRMPEAVHAWQQTVSLAPDSLTASNIPLKITKARALVRLSRLYIEGGQPRAALQALDEAMRNATPGMLKPSGGRTFSFNVAQGRAAAWWALGDAKQATSFEEEAVKLDPDAADAWTHLAKLYAKQGRVEDQHRAEARATALAKQ